MKPDAWFVRELKLINPRYDVEWDATLERFKVVFYHPTLCKKTTCYVIRKTDADGKDIGFHPLDRRALWGAKRAEYFSENPEVAINEVDMANEKIEQEAAEEERLAREDVQRDCRRHYGAGLPDPHQRNQIMVDMGAK